MRQFGEDDSVGLKRVWRSRVMVAICSGVSAREGDGRLRYSSRVLSVWKSRLQRVPCTTETEARGKTMTAWTKVLILDRK